MIVMFKICFSDRFPQIPAKDWLQHNTTTVQNFSEKDTIFVDMEFFDTKPDKNAIDSLISTNDGNQR